MHPVGSPRPTGILLCGRNVMKAKMKSSIDNRVNSKNVKLACWNVRTLLDNNTSNRPQRRSALLAHELRRLDVDIAALSEVRLLEQGSLIEHSAGYTLYWSGRPAGSRRIHGVGLMLKNTIASNLPSLPIGHSERIMSLRLPLLKEEYATIVSVYAPTLDADPSDKDNFYTGQIIAQTPPKDKLVIMGDFNARVGKDYLIWKGILGRHGIGKCNDNGRLLLELCAENQLTVTNTLFQQKDRYKTTWMHPRSKHWHMIDFILVRRCDVKDILHTRVMRSADCNTDHRLVRCKVRLHLKPKPRRRPNTAPSKKFDVHKLQSSANREKYQEALERQLGLGDADAPMEKEPEQLWKTLKNAVLVSCKEVLGSPLHKSKDWFDDNNEEISELLARKRSALQSHLADPSCDRKKLTYRQVCSLVQRKLRTIQNEWWQETARRIQLYADLGDTRNFYQALKAVYGPTVQVQCPLKSADGESLCTDKESILNRWSEHYATLFNANRQVSAGALSNITQQPPQEDLDKNPTIHEVERAISQMKSNKAPGVDGIPPEALKHGGPVLCSRLHKFLNVCWEQGKIPNDLRDAVIITLYKNKGEKSDCSNYRGITLLSIAGKILARILLNRLQDSVAEPNLPESQCGFRANRSTTDMIFVLRQLQEKCIEQNKPLYLTFVDLTKAFDSVSRSGMWKILERLGCPPRFMSMVIQLHEGQRGQVKYKNDLSTPFPISTGVKQGCVLAPTLFSIFFGRMLEQAMRNTQDGVYIRFRVDGGLFNLRRLKAHTKTQEYLVRELLFADDCALVAHNHEDLQRITSCFSDAAQEFGLSISMKKTEVLYQPAPQAEYSSPVISIEGSELNAVKHFTYLGSTISNDARLDKEIDHRLSKANCAFGRLRKRVWNNHHLKTESKLSVYRAIVISALLYGAESWTLYRRHIRLLERFHQRCLRSILKIRWQDRVTNVEVLNKAGLPSIEATLIQLQLRWVGHVYRMEETRLPKMLLYGELCSGKRKRGAPRKRYKDTLKSNLSLCNINSDTWEKHAGNRSAWRQCIRRATSAFEERRRAALLEKRQRKKANIANQDAVPHADPHPCPRCGRVCRSRIGLYSHQKSCKS